MIRTKILHPKILHALATAGHKSTILVADAQFSASMNRGPNTEIVYLNLEAGFPTIPRVVELIAGLVPIERRSEMISPADFTNVVSDEVSVILGETIAADTVHREEFYERVQARSTVLCIVTGDTRRFGNMLLTVGSVVGEQQ